MKIWIILAVVSIAVLIYFNAVASIVTTKESSLSRPEKISRIIFIWLVPIFGFSLALRFSYQAEESEFHSMLVPKLVANWLYDESTRPSNKNRDDNDLKTVGGFSTYDHGSHGDK